MMSDVKIVKDCKNPQVLVVTPLLPGHSISRETRTSIQRNETPYVWLTSTGQANIPTNAQNAINWYQEKRSLPPYYLMIDRDINMGRNMIDRLVAAITPAPCPPIAYAYASFEFRGHINHDFPARSFDINMLLQHNYISSNSLFRLDVVQKVGLVTDEKYKRLLDWAFLLKLFLVGPYVGIPVAHAKFVAASTEKDISAGSPEDYQEKRERVLQDFGLPIADKYNQKQQKPPVKEEASVTQFEFEKTEL